jgi:hypothetical protein
MSDAPRVALRPRRDVTPEQARDARARAWLFIFSRYVSKEAAGGSGGKGNAKRLTQRREIDMP